MKITPLKFAREYMPLEREILGQLRMFLVGLTGGIATGKSTVSAIFKEHNIAVIDSDEIAREGIRR